MNPKAKSLTHQPKTCALAFLDLVPGNYYWPESKTKRERADPETYSEITGTCRNTRRETEQNRVKIR